MTPDPLWQEIRADVEREAQREPLLADFLHAAILRHADLEAALASRLAEKLAGPHLGGAALCDLIATALAEEPELAAAVRADLIAVRKRDPACTGHCEPLLYFKGFHAVEAHRIAHWLWCHDRKALALHLQNRASEVFAVDIHPGARLGKGLFIDHGTGVVIGETAVIEDDVSMLHGVTLGGTGKQTGDRHPKVGAGVLISAGAAIFGNITIGEGAKIGGGSVVLEDVPPHRTAVGVPARVVGRPASDRPALEMDQTVPGTGGDGI
ncbi:MAG: serine O-acetyltransferase, partial [Myxococcota bacterium]